MAHPKIIAIVQARMGSTRLPGKVLMDLAGETVLGRVIKRLRRAALINELVVATTTSVADDAIVKESSRLGVLVFRGSELDVLDRYWQASLKYGADAVVRITSDCPFIDPELVDQTIRVFLDQQADYANNVSPRTYPRGMEAEVFTSAALKRAWKEASVLYQREHVTPYFYEHQEFFHLVSTSGCSDCSCYRWTVDTAEDLRLMREVYTRFEGRDDFSWHEIIELMRREPALADLNAHIVQKQIHGGEM